MDWNYCKRNFIRKTEVDISKINSLLNTSALRLKDIKSRKITIENVSFIIEGYYEAIKELLTALMLSYGLRSRNHQCLISFFYIKFPKYEAESHIISQLSFLRNRLNYYGELIDLSFYNKNKKEIENIIKLIRSLIKR